MGHTRLLLAILSDMKTVFDPDFKLQISDYNFNYQQKLTERLDNFDGDFSQDLVNEIVLWKVNRYAQVDSQTIELLNRIDPKSKAVNEALTIEILQQLLRTKGVQLAMASTFLRYRNSDIYQIIDQRVYRIIYPNKIFKLTYTKSSPNIEKQISIYLKYLSDLRVVCERLNIPFEQADRILFEADRRVNKDEKLLNYGSIKSE